MVDVMLLPTEFLEFIMRCAAWGAMVIAGTMSATGNVSAGDPLLEVKLREETIVGKPLAHDRSVCWLTEPDGRVTRVTLSEVESFRQLDSSFQRLATVELRNALRREFGHGWDIVGTGHYLVCTQGDNGRQYGEIFEDLYRSFRRYFGTRGFQLPEPEFPMVAVVFPDPKQFADYCRADGVPFLPGLKGYYLRTSNRIALFDPGDRRISQSRGQESGISGRVSMAQRTPDRRLLTADSCLPTPDSTHHARWDATIEGDLAATVVHEATHQVAFNLGLHTRIGENPKWIVEGLATMFEAEGARRNAVNGPASRRVNRERLDWFRAYRRRRPADSLPDFIASERLFQTSILDAYSQAWALTFFLSETRSSRYAKYLRQIAERDPLQPYPSRERLADFEKAFGDPAKLEVSFLRFIDELE